MEISRINRKERLQRFFALFLISAGKGWPLVDYEIILTLRYPYEFKHWGHGGHPTYLRLGHYSAGQAR